MNIIEKLSPNFGSRDGNKIKYICVHIMAGSLSGTDNWFSKKESQTSSNYGVGFNGEIHQYVKDENMAWANGNVKNATAEIVINNISLNQNKISLSIENEGFDLAKAPEAQLKALVELIQFLCIKHDIPINRTYIIGHRELNSVSRPTCPSFDNAIMDIIVKRCQIVNVPSTAKQLILEIEDKVEQLKKELNK